MNTVNLIPKRKKTYSIGFIAISLALHGAILYLILALPPQLSFLQGNKNGPTQIEITNGAPEDQKKVTPVSLPDPIPSPAQLERPMQPVQRVQPAQSMRSVKDDRTAPEEKKLDPVAPSENLKAPSFADEAKEATEEKVTNESPGENEPKKDAGPIEEITANGNGTELANEEEALPAGTRLNSDLKQNPGNKQPVYPQIARQKGWEGTVGLTYNISPEGSVSDIEITRSSGYEVLDQEAVHAVSLFRYLPQQEGRTYHRVTFMLTQNSQPPKK
ncbi:MAG: energy transducer TonB [Bdellovibrionales bacterium]|nr:energy transducer TonB [Bdellovibrionales bacterium]